MKLRLILPVMAIVALAACNNSGKDKDKDKDQHDMSMHEHTANGSSDVPALPAIPDGAKVFFKNLKQGDHVTSPFKVEMGTEGIRVDTAGPVVAGSGHHHLIIDGPDSLAAEQMVPKDSSHLHFGKGQTETELDLAPGKHRLTLQFADGLHRSYGGRLSAAITITVKK